jgi:hypothetical protein
MKVVQNPDGSISLINEDERPIGHVEDIAVDTISSEVHQSLIDECERLSQDGMTRFIFDKHLSYALKRVNSKSREEDRDVNIDEILDNEEYYISDENEFNLMPSRFAYYDTETKMTCRWSKHKLVIDWFKKLGFEPGLSNVGVEFEQSFTLSIYDDETGGILYKCILRIQPNLFINLVAEYGDFIENKKTIYKGFFNRSKILNMLNETSPDIYKTVIRGVKLESLLN